MKINIRGVNFDNLTLNETVELILSRLKKGEQTAVYTPNSEIVQACIEDSSLYDVINSAEVICPDGIGVIKAAKILKTPLKEKVAGIEVGEALLAALADGSKSIFFLGGKPGIADLAAEAISKKYPGILQVTLPVIRCRDFLFYSILLCAGNLHIRLRYPLLLHCSHK